jgi:hypothetical protein
MNYNTLYLFAHHLGKNESDPLESCDPTLILDILFTNLIVHKFPEYVKLIEIAMVQVLAFLRTKDALII